MLQEALILKHGSKGRLRPISDSQEVAVGKKCFIFRVQRFGILSSKKNEPVGRYEHLKPKRARNMLPTSDHLSDLRDRAILYAKTLKSQRQQLASPEFWYPYGSIKNFHVLNALLTGQNRNIFRDTTPKRAADIGAADGDVSFFMEQEGWEMTIIDNPPTNWNGLRGAKLFKGATGSAVQILEIDLDSQFLPRDKYDVVFFMGILYHLNESILRA